MISLTHLTKRYGHTLAVDDLNVDIHPGVVTGFLGPNGAGKTTTMRMILGLDRPTSGSAVIDGKPYTHAAAPMQTVGALLDAKALHTSHSPRDHLRWLARAGGVASVRVMDMLRLVELDHAADRKLSGFSLGMFQRLGLAAALLGDPPTLVLDEPANGLDPSGIRWLRDLMREMAAQGRTVLVSSHQLGEIQQTAQTVVVINHGRLVAEVGVDELAAGHERVRVRSPHTEELTRLLADHSARGSAEPDDPDVLMVDGMTAAHIGGLAAEHRIPLHELTPERSSLESAFLSMTANSGNDDESRTQP